MVLDPPAAVGYTLPMIETSRLVLRGWREGDQPRFVALANTPAMMAHMGGVAPPALLDALVDGQMAMQAAHGLCMWAVESRATGDLLGMCGLRYGGHPGTPVPDELEIGWRVAESAWGQGYAREAAQASLAWGWAHTARPRIAAWTVRANRASWGLMLRLGMRARPDLDFDHPRFGQDHPLRRHVTYVLDRPGSAARAP